MLKKETIIQKIKEELPNLRKRFNIKKIGLFGSYSKGKQGEGSDIDIIVEFEKPVGLAFIDLIEYLEQKLGKKVDILTPEGINSIRIKEIAQGIRDSIIYV